jgi:ABC-type phosphate transport system substrate-binding protein
MALLAVMAPSSAHASFTIAACGGSAVQGEGSSLQKAAQQQFWIPTIFDSSFGCGSGAPNVTYNPDGSGCGIASLGGGPTSSKCSDFEGAEAVSGYRAKVTRFAGSDAPLTPAQKTAAEASGGPNPGVIHQIPVASAAIAVIVHFPEGCELKDPGTGTPASGAGSVNDNASTGGVNDPTGAATGDTLANETLRVHINAEEIEKIWNGAVAQTWGNIVPEADFRAATTHTQKECAETPVIRIVRQDGSGTTYNFKAYLSLLPSAPSGLWTTAPVVGDNTVWPVTGSSKTTPVEVNPANNVCEDASRICHAKEKGGGSLASAVEATNGSISYVDLATARQKGFDIIAKKDDHTYWVPLQTINPAKADEVGKNYVEPTVSPLSHVNGNGAPTGANCTNADYRGIPSTPAADPTLGDWSSAIATGSVDTTTYPACALTYDFAFDDDAPVYGNTQLEQERARTVKDYLTAIESNAGQLGLSAADYGTLSLSMIEIGQKGVAAIDWNKSAGSGGAKEEVKKTITTPPTTTSPLPLILAPPSNAFSIAGSKIKGKAIVLSLVLPDPGSVQIKAIGDGVTVSNVTANVSGGSGTVTLAISKAALKKLAKVKGHRLSVKITVTFTPTGGAPASEVKTVTLTQAALTPKKKKAGKGKTKSDGWVDSHLMSPRRRPVPLVGSGAVGAMCAGRKARIRHDRSQHST